MYDTPGQRDYKTTRDYILKKIKNASACDPLEFYLLSNLAWALRAASSLMISSETSQEKRGLNKEIQFYASTKHNTQIDGHSSVHRITHQLLDITRAWKLIESKNSEYSPPPPPPPSNSAIQM